MSIFVEGTRSSLCRTAAAVAVAMLALTGCGANQPSTDDASGVPNAKTGAAEASTADVPVVVTDPWVKAQTEGHTGMFGSVHNSGDADLTVVSAASDVSDDVQLHETLQDESGAMVMSEVKGGFPLPTGATVELKPGGNHIMLMNLKRALQPGEQVTVTLTFDNGETLDITGPVKEFAGADENYSHEGSGKSGEGNGTGHSMTGQSTGPADTPSTGESTASGQEADSR